MFVNQNTPKDIDILLHNMKLKMYVVIQKSEKNLKIIT